MNMKRVVLAAMVAGLAVSMPWMMDISSAKLMVNKDSKVIEGMSLTNSGLQYKDDKVGSGAAAQKGQTIKVHYTGTLYPTGKKFDSSVDRGEPFEFKLGAGQVIPGWDEGIRGMKVGGKRTLVIPPGLAYGNQGVPPVIPPNSTLRFDVELLGVK